jgi:hypothetical protein
MGFRFSFVQAYLHGDLWYRRVVGVFFYIAGTKENIIQKMAAEGI